MHSDAPTHKPLQTNVEIENAAIAFVIERERREGRAARDTRHQGAIADIESDDRIIEVKAAGTTSRGFEVWLEPVQYEAAKAQPDRFWLYLVENVRQGDPSQFRLLRLGGERLLKLIGNAKERRYFSLPIPVAVYDEVAAESGGTGG